MIKEIEYKDLCENVEKLSCSIREYCEREGITQIGFVPPGKVNELEAAGFVVWSDWIDFFNENIADTPVTFKEYNSIRFLQSNEIDYINEMTTMCMGISRNFTAEKQEWFVEWQKDNDIIIIENDNILIGYCCVSIYDDGNIVWVRRIAVKPEYQGKGYGKKLMEQAIAYGVSKGAKRGFLASDVLNNSAISLYKSRGFIPKSETGEITMQKAN